MKASVFDLPTLGPPQPDPSLAPHAVLMKTLAPMATEALDRRALPRCSDLSLVENRWGWDNLTVINQVETNRGQV